MTTSDVYTVAEGKGWRGGMMTGEPLRLTYCPHWGTFRAAGDESVPATPCDPANQTCATHTPRLTVAEINKLIGARP